MEILDLATLDHVKRHHDTGEGKLNLNLLKRGHEKERKQLPTIMQNVYADVSQNPVRSPWTGSQGITHCLTTSSLLYTFARQRVVLPIELMYFQGHSREIRIPPGMLQASLRDLAGEGMCLPCLGTLIYSLFVTQLLPADNSN